MGRMPQFLREPAPRLLDVSTLIDRHRFSVGICRSKSEAGPCIPPNPLSTDLSIVLAPAPRLRGLRRQERGDPETVLPLCPLPGLTRPVQTAVNRVRWVTLAPLWRAVLSPSPAFLEGARDGGVAERLKAHAWKVCMRETVSRVRIPPPPPRITYGFYSLGLELSPLSRSLRRVHFSLTS
jgi:hypothetical protein